MQAEVSTPQRLWDATCHHGDTGKPGLCLHPGPRAGCPMLVDQPLAVHPSTEILCPCSPSIPRARALLPGMGSSMVPPQFTPDAPPPSPS